jgi:kynurenine formamidase
MEDEHGGPPVELMRSSSGAPDSQTDRFLQALEPGVEVYDLGRPLFSGVPRSPSHPPYQLVAPRRHGDAVRPDGSSGANDLLITGSHVGTHIDALSHVSYEGKMHGGILVCDVQGTDGFAQLGVETVRPLVTRGLLLDIPAALGIDRCDPDHEISPSELELALGLTGTIPRQGDVLLVRTGWGQLFDDRPAFEGLTTGTPGPGEEGARWLAAHRPQAVGAETIAFEVLPADPTGFNLPGHRVLLYEAGIHIIEVLDLDRLAAARCREFLFVLSPLKLVGATGSPARPLAITSTISSANGRTELS